MITLHFFLGGGVPDMPHSFGCEATDWFRGIWVACKRFRTWSQCCHFGWSLLCSGVRVSSISKMFLKRYVISTFCAVDRVDLSGGQFQSIKKGKQGNDIHRQVGPLNNCRTKNWQDFL